MNIVLEYINYHLNAKRRHGTHSPFIYDFADNCLTLKLPNSFKKTRKAFYSRQTSDPRSIEITDFGVGSKHLSNIRKVKNIFKTSSSKGKYGTFLYQLTSYVQPDNVLEFGTSLGVGSLHFASASKKATIDTVEACPATFGIATENFQAFHLSNVRAHNLTFDDYIKKIGTKKYDILYIDGHHDGEALLRYIDDLKNNYHNESWIILDDIRWSDSMFEAWNRLREREEFHVTIDLFRMGILLLRPQQEKEHFTIRL